MLTKQRLEEIRERAEKATKGPWYFSRYKETDREWLKKEISSLLDAEKHGDIVYFVGTDNDLIVALTGNGPTSADNARFLSQCIQDVPTLLAEVERLRVGLLQISESKYCDYTETATGIYAGPYGVGVTDGHRYCANVARKVLGEPFIKDALDAADAEEK